MAGKLKGDLINDAYSQMRISGLTVQPTPEDLDVALMRLENMMAEFSIRNINVGYTLEDDPDPNTPHNVERWAWHGIATNLAIRLIPDFNKEVPQTLFAQASQSLSNMSGRTALVRQVNYPSRQPRGSGNTQRYNRWARFYRPPAEAPLESATITMQINDIDDFIEHFDAYLNLGEDVASYTISADDGLEIVSDSLSTPDVSYRIKAIGNDDSSANSLQQVTIVATTDAGRVETRVVNFQILGDD